jgi:uncharacterized protein YndB with AHSA1/START domain
MTNNNEIGSITTTVKEREFVVERVVDAPRELVFKAFTEAEHLAKWWAPYPYTIPVCNIDLRPGGIWLYCMRSPKGEDFWVKSVYREVVKPERVVYIATFVDEQANPIEGPPQQLGALTFDDYEGKTKLTFCFQFESAEDLKTTLAMQMVEGLAEALKNLDNLVRELQH